MHQSIIKIISFVLCFAMTCPVVVRPAVSVSKKSTQCLAPKMQASSNTEEESIVQQLLTHITRPDLVRPEPNTAKEWIREYGAGIFVDALALFGTVVFIIAKTVFEQFVHSAPRQEPTKAQLETMLSDLAKRVMEIERTPNTGRLEKDLQRASGDIDLYIQKYILALPDNTAIPQQTIRFYNQVILLNLWNKFPEMFNNQLGEVSAPDNIVNPLSLESIMRKWDKTLARDLNLCGNQLRFGLLLGGATQQIAEFIFTNRMNTLFPDNASSLLANFYADTVLIHYIQQIHGVPLRKQHPARNKNSLFRLTYAKLSKRGYNVRTLMHRFNIARNPEYLAAFEYARTAPHNNMAQLEAFGEKFFKDMPAETKALGKIFNAAVAGSVQEYQLSAVSQTINQSIRTVSVDRADFRTLYFFELLTVIDLWNKYPEMFGHDFSFFKKYFKEYESRIRQPDQDINIGRSFFVDTVKKVAAELFSLRLEHKHPAKNNTKKATLEHITDLYTKLAAAAYGQAYHWPQPEVSKPSAAQKSISGFMLWLLGTRGYSAQKAFRAINSPRTLAHMDELFESQPEFFQDEILHPAVIMMDIVLLQSA